MNCKGMNDGDGNHNCSRMITHLDKLIEREGRGGENENFKF
jgi:hypothetical protein